MTTNYHNNLNKQIFYAIKHIEGWFYTAVNDLKSKYKRTKLGSTWNFLTYLITLSIMCVVWSLVFKTPIIKLFPYVFNGFIIFFVFSLSVSASCEILIESKKDVFLNLPIPFLCIVLREVLKYFFSYFHFILLIIPMYFFLFNFNSMNIVLYFVGLIFFFFNTVLFSSLVCILCTRFRDIVPLSNSILSSLTLLTPILWSKEMLGEYQDYVYLNPLSFMIEAVRSPMIGIIPNMQIYIYNVSLLIVLYIFLFLILKFKGNRLIYWA